MSNPDIDFTHGTLDQILQPGIGEYIDIHGSISENEYIHYPNNAQRQKYELIADQLHIHEGTRVLEIGCNWGAFLKYVKENRGAETLSLARSASQFHAYWDNGLSAYIRDFKTLRRYDFGTFDALVSAGEFEHLCSRRKYQTGKQDLIYQRFFKTASYLLPAGGRFYLESMAFTEKMMADNVSGRYTDKNSDAYYTILAANEFTNTWLPYGAEMIIRNAAPYFRVVNIYSGRLEYLDNVAKWKNALKSFSIKRPGSYLKLLFRLLKDKEFRHMLNFFRTSPLQVCIERGLIDPLRIVFEKVDR